MSKLEKLIKELCPNGVEYKKFSESCSYIRGVTYNKNKEARTDDTNPWKVLRANNITLSNNSLNFEDIKLIKEDVKIKKEQFLHTGDILICAGSGSKEHIGKVAYISKDINYTFGGFMAVIRCISCLNSRFLFHILSGNFFKSYLNVSLNSTTINNLSSTIMNNFSIPVPPLSVQAEIVRILDNFTDLTAELTAELTARKKQYEYYRDELLNFNDAQYYQLEDICDIVDYRGKTPKKVSKGIFLVTAKNIRQGYIDYDKSQEYISNEDFDLVMHRGKVKIGDVLITTEAPCGNVALVDREDIALAQRVIKYRPKNSSVDSSFLKYILMGKEFQDKLLSAATGGTVKGIKGSKLHKLTIPIPSIEKQHKVVELLNRFDTLCNDISSGLPAEIEARQKQYEYYRDKLLDFKNIDSSSTRAKA